MANKGVIIEIGGRPRTLRFDTNSICDFEQVTGVSVQQLSYRSGLHVTRALLWAGLKHEQPDLTLVKVGEWLDAYNQAVGGQLDAGQALAKKIEEALVLAGIFTPPEERGDAADDDSDAGAGGESGEAPTGA